MKLTVMEVSYYFMTCNIQLRYLVYQIEVKDYLLFEDADGNFTGIFNVKVMYNNSTLATLIIYRYNVYLH